MADTKISDLTAVTSLVGTDEFVLARSGATKKITATDLAGSLGSGLISEIVVPSGGSANIDFTSIPGTYRHLELWYAARSEGTATDLMLRFNNDSGANYGVEVLRGGGTGASAATVAGSTSANIVSIAATGGTYDGMGKIMVPYYATGAFTRTAISEYALHDGTNRVVGTFAGFWSSTAAVTRITLFTQSGSDVKEGSIFSLYGVT